MRPRPAGLAAAALAFAVASCGSDPNYRAGPFSECLSSRGANPTAIERTSSDADVSFVVSQIARQAEQDNGAVRAFGAADETFPGASEADFLFFADGDAAERAARRVDQAIERLEAKLAGSAPYTASVRRNLLTVSTRRTGAQQQVIDECLRRSEE
jgi:hypothetical protein